MTAMMRKMQAWIMYLAAMGTWLLLKVTRAQPLPSSLRQRSPSQRPGYLSPQQDCEPELLGFGALPLALADVAAAFLRCGIVKLKGAFDPAELQLMMGGWQYFSSNSDTSPYESQIMELRGGRNQTHLPYLPPFNEFGLLGSGNQLHAVLMATLGPHYVLDETPMVVAARAGASEQGVHQDAPMAGSLTVWTPLQAIDAEDFGSLGMAILKKLRVQFRPAKGALVLAKGTFKGLRISGFGNQDVGSLGWAVDDEVYALNMSTCTDQAQVARIFKAVEGLTPMSQEFFEGIFNSEAQCDLLAEVVRPLVWQSAPMALGDAVLYDARAYHWGRANRRFVPRSVLFVMFKSHMDLNTTETLFELPNTQEMNQSLSGFQEHFRRLRQNLKGAEALRVERDLATTWALSPYVRDAPLRSLGPKDAIAPSSQPFASAVHDGLLPIPTFVVNLQRRPDRKRYMQTWLTPLDASGELRVTFINATDGTDPEPIDLRLEREGYRRFDRFKQDCQRLPLSRRFNFFYRVNNSLVTDRSLLAQVDSFTSRNESAHLNYWFCREQPNGTVASAHSHVRAWHEALQTTTGPYALFLEDDVKIEDHHFVGFRRALQEHVQRQRDDAQQGQCDVVYLFKTLPEYSLYLDTWLPPLMSWGMVDGTPDAHGWATVGNAWMSNAYMLSRRALQVVASDHIRQNLMGIDDLLPALVSESPHKGIQEFARKAGIANSLRACICTSKLCHYACWRLGNCGIKMELGFLGVSDTQGLSDMPDPER
eukprot:TRINITY_DN42151_c0_g1_i1.p1 TRINITY_DN42151_c0_g1~~TRINITY_DN42151_c0_g1_i1.p1  ORF type:complete len:763 (-),score=139.47 TRINITY_DN42151_c0_g1_i1:16-2304(-)